jgi:serine/threonine-protein kinase
MGVVYRAEHRRLGRDVALKIMSPELSNDEEFRKRFERESTLAAALDHPHIVPIYDAGQARGLLYIAMRYVPGNDLRQVLETKGALSLERSVSIISQISDGLGEAHDEGLVHRDVKPANILLMERRGGGEHAYLTDFGLAKRYLSSSSLTRSGYYVGTMAYSAPEVFKGGVIDARADVYSLGCVLFECLTGRAPFAREQDLAVIYAHLHEDPPRATELRPDLPPAVDEVLARAMAKEPEARYSSSGEFMAAVAQLPLPVGAGTTHVPTPAVTGDGEVTPPGSDPAALLTNPPRPVDFQPISPDLPPISPDVYVQPQTGPDQASTIPPRPLETIPPLPPERKPRRGRRGLLVVIGVAILALVGAGVAVAVLGNDAPGPSSQGAGLTLSAAFKSTCTGLRCRFVPTDEAAGRELSWDFGDGSAPSTAPTATHVYEEEGTYEVTLSVVGPSGASAEQGATVTLTLPVESRDVSFALEPSGGELAVSGEISSPSTQCVRGAEVIVERRKQGGWGSVGKPVTASGSGRFEATIPDQPGTYRATVPQNETVTVACKGAASEPKTREAPAPTPAADTPSEGTTTTEPPSTGVPSSGSGGGSDGGGGLIDELEGGGGGGGGGGCDVPGVC